MKSIIKKSAVSAGLALALATAGVGTASATTLELALALDSSGSMSSGEWALQVDAYNSIFTAGGGSFFTNYVSPYYDNIVVSAYQFGETVSQEIGWTTISSDADLASFGSLFTVGASSGTTFYKYDDGSLTNTQGVIDAAAAGLTGNGIIGDKMVIDISTDGEPTTCDNGCGFDYTGAAITAAANAYADGVTTNAIGVGVSSSGNTILTNLVAAGGGFYMTANDFTTFKTALETKLKREITGQVPEPSVLFLFGAGLLGMGIIKRRQRNV